MDLGGTLERRVWGGFRECDVNGGLEGEDTLDRASSGPGGCLDGGGTVPPVVPQPPGLSPLHPEVNTPKRQAVVDRLRRRIESYRRRHDDCMPRFDQSFTGVCEQNLQQTLELKQRFLDAKSKRVPKSKDKKQQDSIQSSVHVQQKFLKRSSEEHDPGGGAQHQDGGGGFEPPVKLQCTTQGHGTHQSEGMTKFSVEIVQQLEFTTSAANSQPQQISTNVTVKAHTNASVKSDVSSPKSSNPATPASASSTANHQQQQQQKSNIGLDVGTLVECVKQEPDNDFADLDQCAAALEKDAAANGGAAFGGFSDLIGEDTNDEIITSAAFNDLISDISNYPELMKDFDFEDNKPEPLNNGLKVEDQSKDPQQNDGSNNNASKNTHSPLVPNYSPSPVFDGQSMGNKRMQQQPYSNMEFCKTELSPAAQTLKQMAEQHQHKNQMGMSFNPNHQQQRTPNSRSPYPGDFQFQNQQADYGSPQNANAPNFHKNGPNFPHQPDMIKQEMIYQGSNDFDGMKRKGGIYKQQQYSPYSSPSASSHGSPGYLPRGGTNSGGGGPTGAPFGGGTPPRPSSGPGGGGGGGGATLQINQAQQLHISQQNHGHAIQVSAGQHVQLSGDLKGNVSIAAQQGMHFNQHATNTTSSQQQQQQQQQQHQQQQQQSQQSQQQQNPSQQSPLSGSQSHQSANNPQMHQNSNVHHPQQNPVPGSQLGSPMMGNSQQIPNNQQQQQPMGGMMGMGGPMQESYSMSQTQTINFTQQTLRQRASGPVPNPMGPTGGPMGPGPMGGGQPGMGPRLMNSQTLEQQKLLQQQQMLRAQQAAMQQHMVRPPPPDYKTSAGMMQGMQPRYAAAGPPSMRRMPHQPMPPSGPMIRPHNMYMLQQQQQQQQQHVVSRNMYPRQQPPPMGGGMDGMQHGSAEWRHLMMSQQQSGNFSPQMRPNMQQGFNMNSALQHQQIRAQQQGMVSNMGPGGQQGMVQGQVMGQSVNPMAQMNSMNQQMLHMQQQQSMMQQQQQQQQNSQMSISSIHMQQTQSMTVTNQAMQQQNMTNQQLVNNPNNNQNNALSNFNPQTADFNLEFLENLQSTTFTDQELLNSFDSDPGFNLDSLI